jgi:L-ascorbate metabolism protein UlaG (beta-lactamase superfamily)
MRLRWLGWAGFEVEAEGELLAIDPLIDTDTPWLGEPQTELVPPTAGAARAVLLSHLHRDHADVAAIGQALGPEGVVLRPAPADGTLLEVTGVGEAEAAIAKAGLELRVMAPGETADLGPFTVTATPAADGSGDPQVGWVVRAGERAIFHGGDTMWHAQWWSIAVRHRPLALACLPVNGARIDFPHRQPAADVAAVMTPEQAVAAARALRAGALVPMHHGTFDYPPLYRPEQDEEERVRAAAARHGVEVVVPPAGEWLEVPAHDAPDPHRDMFERLLEMGRIDRAQYESALAALPG